ncbi:DUF924 family protein [Paracoccus benzoatiresistens]|uniref:DUF924 domain-containing protein n=1 Tax=Paracoccus benzoatiresistens TaxID=2997341 RepID=A0ABT4J0X2_9RHOB|nr:DUF924 family protein [Paracoccus sp. EF6]MCZ0960056.1 DUF924 domain-containing protein [Paracoccus sp. EF6]
MTIRTAQDVLDFWFSEEMEPHWFAKSDEIDARIRDGFADTYHAAHRRELDNWARTPDGALALIVVLDQFPRNIFRGTGRTFESDDIALEHARAAVDAGFDQQIDAKRRVFLYLPFEHSEDLPDQTMSVELFEALGDPGYLDYAIQHHDIIEKFGRFPHRNTLLDRPNTPDEEEFLKTHKGF